MCIISCDKCGEAVEDLENMLFDCAFCNECYDKCKDNFERWLKGE